MLVLFSLIMHYLGEDFNATGLLSNSEGNSNLRWRPGNAAPNTRFVIPIIDDDMPEATEMFEVSVECEQSENCYLPRAKYTVTIVDDDGMYYIEYDYLRASS